MMKKSQIEKSKLKKVLNVCCILSLVGTTFWLLISVLLIFMNSDSMQEYLLPYIKNAGLSLDGFLHKYEYATLIGISKSILNALSLIGIIMMLRVNKKGFYIYAFAQLAILFVSPIISGTFSFNLLYSTLVIVWISIYALVFYLISKEKPLMVHVSNLR